MSLVVVSPLSTAVLYMFKDYQANLSWFLHPHWNNVFIQPPLCPPANFIHSICSDSDSSRDKFNKYISFCNKSHIVLRKISAGFFYYCVHCCLNNQSTCRLWIIGECTCGSGCCTVLNTYICMFFTIRALQQFSVGYRLCVGSTSICHFFGRQSGELFVI